MLELSLLGITVFQQVIMREHCSKFKFFGSKYGTLLKTTGIVRCIMITATEKQLTIICTRQAFQWHYALVFLDTLKGMGMMKDSEFRARFDSLYTYVARQLNPPIDSDIVNRYVVIEQHIPVE